MRERIGNWLLACIRSTEANKQAYSTRRLLNMLKADHAGYMVTLQRRLNLLESDYAALRNRIVQLEQRRGKRG